MTYLIDAWLDRPQPYLRILNRNTGEVCAVLEEQALDELRDVHSAFRGIQGLRRGVNPVR